MARSANQGHPPQLRHLDEWRAVVLLVSPYRADPWVVFIVVPPDILRRYVVPQLDRNR